MLITHKYTHTHTQIYSFGGIPIYLDNDVVFADLAGKGQTHTHIHTQGGFAPVALETLLQHVQ
jgi:hypothetical protein